MIKNLVVCADRNSVTYADVFFKSLFINTHDKTPINVYFISYDFPKELIIDLKQKLRLIKQIRFIPIVLDISHPQFSKILDNLEFKGNKASYFSKSMFMKLLISECLPADIDWCLYIDLDSMILKDISNILQYELDENIVYYACKDRILSQQLNYLNELNNLDKSIVRNRFTYLELLKQKLDQVKANPLSNNYYNSRSSSLNLSLPEDISDAEYQCFTDNTCIINLKAIRERNYSQLYLNYLTTGINDLPLVNYFLNIIHSNEWQILPDAYGLSADIILKTEQNHKTQHSEENSSDNTIFNNIAIPYIVKYNYNKPLASNDKLPYRKVFFYLYVNTYLDIRTEIKNIYKLISSDKFNSYTHLTPIGYMS